MINNCDINCKTTRSRFLYGFCIAFTFVYSDLLVIAGVAFQKNPAIGEMCEVCRHRMSQNMLQYLKDKNPTNKKSLQTPALQSYKYISLFYSIILNNMSLLSLCKLS